MAGASSHLLATDTLSSPVLYRLLRRQYSDRRALNSTVIRWWPSGNPRLSAFCRSAPTVRFMAFAIFFAGDLLRECAFSSRTSALDQVRRLVRLVRLLAI